MIFTTDFDHDFTVPWILLTVTARKKQNHEFPSWMAAFCCLRNTNFHIKNVWELPYSEAIAKMSANPPGQV